MGMFCQEKPLLKNLDKVSVNKIIYKKNSINVGTNEKFKRTHQRKTKSKINMRGKKLTKTKNWTSGPRSVDPKKG